MQCIYVRILRAIGLVEGGWCVGHPDVARPPRSAEQPPPPRFPLVPPLADSVAQESLPGIPGSVMGRSAPVVQASASFTGTDATAISASAPQNASGAHLHPLEWQAPYEVIALRGPFQLQFSLFPSSCQLVGSYIRLYW